MSADVEIVCKKGGLKKLMKRLYYLPLYCATSGIHKAEGGQPARKPMKKRTKGKIASFSIADLAEAMEYGFSYILGKDRTIATSNDKKPFVTFKAGTRISVAPRPFIRLYGGTGDLNTIKDFVRGLVQSYFDINQSSTVSKAFAKNFWTLLSKKVAFLQQQRITLKKTLPNQPITALIKGFNHPLFETGQLLHSIKGKAENSAKTGLAKTIQQERLKVQIENFEKFIKGF